MISLKLFKHELQAFIPDTLKDYREGWGERVDQRNKFSELVSLPMPEPDAILLKKLLDRELPSSVFKFDSRTLKGSFRVVIKGSLLERDLKNGYFNESAYINCFLSAIRPFPHAFWFTQDKKCIKACYPAEYHEYHPMLVLALNEFGSTCFQFSRNEQGDLIVDGKIKEIRKVIASHKSKCLPHLNALLKESEGQNISGISKLDQLSNITEFSNQTHENLVASTIHEGGLPGLMFKVQNTETYEKVEKCFPEETFEVHANDYRVYTYNSGADEYFDCSVGVKIKHLETVCSLVMPELCLNLDQKIHEARENFRKQIEALETKGRYPGNGFCFFPKDVTKRIYKDVGSDKTFFTQSERVVFVEKVLQEFGTSSTPKTLKVMS